ncbi:MAG: DNA replication and repair protein RecF [Bacteroidaceae bacterium]|nr:DNA replication and repair protein RecF [Bacteroidaceae bacterium]
MTLKHLSILNYKNIAEAELDFSSGLNCVIGSNGEGKTNLLDSIRFLSLCKSLGVNQDSLCIRHEQDFFMLKGLYENDNEIQEEIHCSLKRGQKKIMRRQGKPYKRLAEHIGLIPIVLVSPADNMLISGGGEERRRFMDVVISQMDLPYLDALTRYNKALMQRNALLKEGQACDPEMLSLWEEQMATEGEFVYRRRQEYMEHFTPIFQRYYDLIAQNHENVTVSYTSHCQRGPLLQVIRSDRNRDLAVGYSLHGIHRDELEMKINGYPVRREGSQGQSKTMLVALKLAQYEFLHRTGTGTRPILLLDDIFDRLDAQRVERIVALVSGDSFGQTFITDTNREHLDKILSLTPQDHKIFHCINGNFTEIAHR